ncbi:MAG: cysteine-rich CWC family protein [Candidatus Acidiferrales bacterium]
MTAKGDRAQASGTAAQRPGCAPTRKKCEACGEMFDCGAPERGCWCEDLKLASEAAAELRGRFADCVCPRCLAAAAKHGVRA